MLQILKAEFVRWKTSSGEPVQRSAYRSKPNAEVYITSINVSSDYSAVLLFQYWNQTAIKTTQYWNQTAIKTNWYWNQTAFKTTWYWNQTAIKTNWYPTCLTWWPHDHLTCLCRVSNPGRSGGWEASALTLRQPDSLFCWCLKTTIPQWNTTNKHWKHKCTTLWTTYILHATVKIT